MSLKEFERNVSSQWGEDGVLEEIFRRLNISSGSAVEFGAWDGKYLSNTWNLWYNGRWKCTLIEGDEKKYQDLEQLKQAFPDKLQVINDWVKNEGEHSIDKILDRFNIGEIDLLSVDIDGDDYHVLASLERCPKVIVVEFNPTVPPHIDLIQKPGGYLGSSPSALLKLAKTKNYKLAHLTYTNLILVHAEWYNSLGIEEPSLASLFPYEELTYVISSYDGEPLLSREMPYAPYLESSDTRLKEVLIRKIKSRKKRKALEYVSNKSLIACLIRSAK